MTRRNNTLILLCIVVLAILMRSLLLFKPFCGHHSWNEGYYSMIAINFDKYGLGNQMSYLGRDFTISPFLPILIYFSIKLFGNVEWAARLPVFIFGILSLVVLYPVAKEFFGEKVAIISMLFSSIAPGIVYFSRNIQLESPSVFFILLAVYLLIKSPDIKCLKDGINTWCILSMISMSIAIFVKYYNLFAFIPLFVIYIKKPRNTELSEETNQPRNPTIRISKIIPFIIYCLIALIPSIIWILYGAKISEGATKGYFWRPSEWSMVNLKSALLITPTLIRKHLSIIRFFSIIGIIHVLINWKKNLFLISYILPWFSLLFLFPLAYSCNGYYDYPALYGFAICGALGFQLIDGRKLKIVLLIIIVIVGIYRNVQKYSNFEEPGFNIDLARKLNETSFYSAKYVSKIRKNDETIVVGWPATMYYAGGDPQYITCSFDDIRKFIASEKYDYIILNYFRQMPSEPYDIDEELINNFRRHNYERIVPMAWKKLKV